MLKKIMLVLAALATLLVGVIVMQPATYKVVRSATIHAPQAEVFALINDFHKWDEWSPWAKIDPQMKTTYSGAAAGAGAVYQWAGNSDVGEGRMTIKESKPGESILIDLEFLKPFESRSLTTFTLQADGPQMTKVTWEMAGDNNFMSKAMTLFASMDKMVGGDFEKGLNKMKSTAESASKK